MSGKACYPKATAEEFSAVHHINAMQQSEYVSDFDKFIREIPKREDDK